jgi:hypothetical protein
MVGAQASLVFGWAQVAERRVAALSIVERFDVLRETSVFAFGRFW